MDLKQIEQEFDEFFEFQTEDRSTVSSVSARLFARHVAEIFAEELQGDIATLEQENRQVRARNERLDKDLESFLEAHYKDGIAGYKTWVAINNKTGNEYSVIGKAIDATNATEGRTMAIYRGNGQTFVRSADEFIEKFRVSRKAGLRTCGQRGGSSE